MSSSLAAVDNLSDAQRLSRQGQWSQALAKVEVHLASQPNEVQGRFLRGAMLAEVGRSVDAIVVDTEKSRLYLYENDRSRPRFVADYYITHGKFGADKMREGDKKTPVGVYHVTADLSAKKLGDLYGSGAFPINYPNERDKRLGRKGHGIWLHGTPSDTLSRPPKASNGCVVLANIDLNALATDVQVGVTPVIISDSIEWLSLADWETERRALNQEIEAWGNDWESRDMDPFLKHYSTAKQWVKVGLSRQSTFRSPGSDGVVLVSFDQQYTSNNLNNQMKKRQYWIREVGTWKIIYEGTA